jgi:hypothetical protein
VREHQPAGNCAVVGVNDGFELAHDWLFFHSGKGFNRWITADLLQTAPLFQPDIFV